MPSTDTPDPVIELRRVSRRFMTPDGRSLLALRDFDLTVQRGEFVAIVGPTGCGKSTTLNLITGLAQPTTGGVRVLGRPVGGIDPRLGFVFQADALFPWRNVLDNVSAGPRFRGRPRPEAEAEARAWIQRVGLAGFERHYPHQLSGGMRKRCALAQTFINRPEVLLMDEPFSALDAQTREVLQIELMRIHEKTGKTTLFVTHDLDEAIYLSDRIVVLAAKPGRIKQIIDVPFAHPRPELADLRIDARFQEIRREIWHLIRSPTQAAA
jgi:NitT/TauT family transport system ATP-binding protein